MEAAGCLPARRQTPACGMRRAHRGFAPKMQPPLRLGGEHVRIAKLGHGRETHAMKTPSALALALLLAVTSAAPASAYSHEPRGFGLTRAHAARPLRHELGLGGGFHRKHAGLAHEHHAHKLKLSA